MINKKTLSMFTKTLNTFFNKPSTGKWTVWRVKVKVGTSPEGTLTMPIKFVPGHNSVKFYMGKKFSFIYMDVSSSSFDFKHEDCDFSFTLNNKIDDEDTKDKIIQAVKVYKPDPKSVANSVNKEFDSFFSGRKSVLPLFCLREDGSTVAGVVGTYGMRSYTVYVERHGLEDRIFTDPLILPKYFSSNYGTKNPKDRPELFFLPMELKV